MNKNKTIVILTGTARNEAGSGEIYTFLDRRKIKTLLLSFLMLTVSTATLPAQAEDPAEPCEEPPCELVEPCEDPPCECEEPPCGPVEPCEEPPCEPEPHSYLPLFGEYETSYNIFGGGADLCVTHSFYYIGEREFDGKIYKVFNGNDYLRATEDNSKVYSLKTGYSFETQEYYLIEEILTFDISLEKGDHFTYYYPREIIDCIVDSVYTDEKGRKNLILLSSDKYWDFYYKKYCPFVSLKFVEGEGSSAGLFCDLIHDYYDMGTFLLCSYKDGEQSYFYYEDFGDVHEKYGCGYYSSLFYVEPSCQGYICGSIDDIPASDWLVYPNPFDDTFYVKHDIEKIKLLFVYNTAGELLLRIEINDTSAAINLSASAGTYYVSIITETGKRYHNKIIKL